LVFVAAVLTAGGLFRTAMALRLEPALIQRTGNRLDVILCDRHRGCLLADWSEPLLFLCEVRKGAQAASELGW